MSEAHATGAPGAIKTEGPECLDGTGAFMRRWWVQRFSATFVTLPFEHHGASSELGSVRISSRSQTLARPTF